MYGASGTGHDKALGTVQYGRGELSAGDGAGPSTGPASSGSRTVPSLLPIGALPASQHALGAKAPRAPMPSNADPVAAHEVWKKLGKSYRDEASVVDHCLIDTLERFSGKLPGVARQCLEEMSGWLALGGTGPDCARDLCAMLHDQVGGLLASLPWKPHPNVARFAQHSRWGETYIGDLFGKLESLYRAKLSAVAQCPKADAAAVTDCFETWSCDALSAMHYQARLATLLVWLHENTPGDSGEPRFQSLMKELEQLCRDGRPVTQHADVARFVAAQDADAERDTVDLLEAIVRGRTPCAADCQLASERQLVRTFQMPSGNPATLIRYKNTLAQLHRWLRSDPRRPTPMELVARLRRTAASEATSAQARMELLRDPTLDCFKKDDSVAREARVYTDRVVATLTGVGDPAMPRAAGRSTPS